MNVCNPGSHGSTFGGNPIASAIALASLEVLEEEKMDERAREMGDYFVRGLHDLNSDMIKEVRGKGLLTAVELDETAGPARKYVNRLKEEGILAKDTHGQTIRFAPALVITKKELDWALERIAKVLEE